MPLELLDCSSELGYKGRSHHSSFRIHYLLLPGCLKQRAELLSTVWAAGFCQLFTKSENTLTCTHSLFFPSFFFSVCVPIRGQCSAALALVTILKLTSGKTEARNSCKSCIGSFLNVN